MCLGRTKPRRPINSRLVSIECPPPHLRTHRYGTAHGSANHFFRAPSPTYVLSRVLNRDGQVVRTMVMTCLSTRRTSRYKISPDLPRFTYVLKNSKLMS